MPMEKISRFARFTFYLALGGWTALASACAGTTDGRGREGSKPAADGGKYPVPDAGGIDAGAGGGKAGAGGAGTGDAARDAGRADGNAVPDSSEISTDGGQGGSMWDVICE
jgi:hypothetical protein